MTKYIDSIINDLCDSSGLDENVSKMVIETYVKQSVELCSLIRRKLIECTGLNSQLVEIQNLLHKLKGSSGNVRANQIMDLASNAEMTAKAVDMTETLKLVEEICMLVNLYLHELNEGV